MSGVKFQDHFTNMQHCTGAENLVCCGEEDSAVLPVQDDKRSEWPKKENEDMKKYVMFMILAAFFATALAGCKKGG